MIKVVYNYEALREKRYPDGRTGKSMAEFLYGAIAYRIDLPNYADVASLWLGVRNNPIVVQCERNGCNIKYSLIEPDNEADAQIEGDRRCLLDTMKAQHPNHQSCIPFRNTGRPDLKEHARLVILENGY